MKNKTWYRLRRKANKAALAKVVNICVTKYRMPEEMAREFLGL